MKHALIKLNTWSNTWMWKTQPITRIANNRKFSNDPNERQKKSTCFSPKKFLILISLFLLPMEALIGKWAYTILILYRYPTVTPVIRFATRLPAVWIVALAFREPNQDSILSLHFPVSLLVISSKSTSMWLQVSNELSTRTFNLDCLCVNLDLDLIRYVHHLWGLYGLHLYYSLQLRIEEIRAVLNCYAKTQMKNFFKNQFLHSRQFNNFYKKKKK